ncbi:MAG TPA: DUF1206 domain-containing protein [Acidimicrobiia bacterium]|nr:DUF1206 domain-containing protein [Acidimicrobiia bacterium]
MTAPSVTPPSDLTDRLESARDEVRDSTAVEGIARTGLAARGVMYSVIALLALQIAWGDRKDQADKDGALETVARQPLGKVLLVILAAGFAAYAFWRLVQVFVADEDVDAKGVGKRLGYLFRAALYAVLSWSAVAVVLSSSERSQDGRSGSDEREWTARVFEWPAGRAVVVAVGLAVIGFGLYNGFRAARGKWKKKLALHEASPMMRTWITRVAAVGLSARMIVYVLVGIFLIQAAWQYDAREAVGIDGALRRLADRAWGTWMLVAVAFGLFAYGLYSFVEARYRRVPEE